MAGDESRTYQLIIFVIKFFNICVVSGVCALLALVPNAYSAEHRLEASVNARAEYNDNIFLTSGPHDAVSGVIITPSLSGIIKEQNWQTELKAKLRLQKYSDATIDGNDQFFSLTGRYNGQRNIFSLNINHDLDSNLDSTTTDFGIAGRRVDRKNQSISPRYTRLLTERLVLTLSYTYSDVDFLEVENTAYTSYVSDIGSVTLLYDLTEKNPLSFVLQAVDYRSKGDLLTYQLLVSRIGIEHKFSDELSIDFQAGVSRRESTRLVTGLAIVSGQVIRQTQQHDFNDRGFVLDAGVTQQLETGSIQGRISRDNTTNSFGGLDQVDVLKVSYTEKLSALWRYDISARVEDIVSLSKNTADIDRDLFFFESRVFYSITEKWSVNAGYRYIARRYKSDNSESRAPHSNMIYAGLTYNFPALSTF